MTQHIKPICILAACIAITLTSAPSFATKGQEIRVQGPNSTYKIAPTEDPKNWTLKGPGMMTGFALQAREKGSWVVLDPAQTIRQRSEVTDGRNLKVIDPEGNLRHSVVFSSAGFQVLYPDGEVLRRIVLVDDKNFEIYNSVGNLIMTGRSKGKTITVKDVTTKQRLFKIKGRLTIEDGAFFAIPLQFTETVVIWKTASRR